MLTWGVMAALAVGVYAMRCAGAVLVDAERLPARWRRVLDTLPTAILAAVIALSTFGGSEGVTLDARAVGVLAAAVCAWRRLPMLVTVVVAAFATALVRALT